jgi:ribosome recycling factor
MTHEIVNSLEGSMQKTIDALKKDLSTISTGRATPSLLDSIKVESYGGTMVLLKNISNVTVSDPTTLFVQIWDKNMLSPAEKAIQNANLGFNPQIDGNGLRISVPKLSEERRKELCKIVKKYGEDKKVSLRNLRKEANEEAKKLKGTVSEDEIKQIENDVQKTTDKYNQEIDKLTDEKSKILLTY